MRAIAPQEAAELSSRALLVYAFFKAAVLLGPESPSSLPGQLSRFGASCVECGLCSTQNGPLEWGRFGRESSVRVCAYVVGKIATFCGKYARSPSSRGDWSGPSAAGSRG